jgi:hypothetical protein
MFPFIAAAVAVALIALERATRPRSNYRNDKWNTRDHR